MTSLATATLLATLLGAGPGPADPPWDCSGNLVPPAGYEQETSFAGPGALQQAVDEATQRLVSRLCQDVPCPEVTGELSPWKTGSAPDRACAMVVVPTTAIATWHAHLTPGDLDQQLDRAASALLGEGGRAVVALGPVRQSEGGAGEAGRWLRDAMLRVLSGRPGLTVRDAPAAAEGEGPPKGVDALLSANAYARQEGQLRLVEVRWVARSAKAGLRAAPPILVPEAAVPRPPAPGAAPAKPAPRVQLTAYVLCQRHRPDGTYQNIPSCTEAALHEDDRVKVVVEVDRPARLYILDSNSTGQFQTLYPDPGQANALAPGGQVTIPAGDEWLILDGVGGVTERFQVVAAAEPVPTLEALRGADLGPRDAAGQGKLAQAQAVLAAVGSRGFKRKPAAASGQASLREALAATVPLVAAHADLTVLEFQLQHR